MNTFLAKALIVVTAFSLALPESQARRVGSGRSAGRQAQMRRAPQPSQPTTPPQRRPAPDFARQSAPPPPPSRQPSRWGGALGGVLAGLGLGALLSHGANSGATETSGSSGTSGTSATNDTQQAAEQRAADEQESGIGMLPALALLAVAVLWLRRRWRNHQSRDESGRSSQRRF